MDNESESGEPPSSSSHLPQDLGHQELSQEDSSNPDPQGGDGPTGWAPWTIEFNLQDLIGGSLESDDVADDDVADVDSQLVQQFLNDQSLSLDKMRSAIAAALEQHDVNSAEVSVAMVSGPTMRRLNQQYLQHDYDTDVLSFCLSDPDSPDLMAQLIVSLDYAKSQVEQLRELSQDYCVNDELCLYLVHGTLHTLGYDDHQDEDRQEMRDTEREVLATIGIVPCWPEAESEGATDE